MLKLCPSGVDLGLNCEPSRSDVVYEANKPLNCRSLIWPVTSDCHFLVGVSAVADSEKGEGPARLIRGERRDDAEKRMRSPSKRMWLSASRPGSPSKHEIHGCGLVERDDGGGGKSTAQWSFTSQH